MSGHYDPPPLICTLSKPQKKSWCCLLSISGNNPPLKMSLNDVAHAYMVEQTANAMLPMTNVRIMTSDELLRRVDEVDSAGIPRHPIGMTAKDVSVVTQIEFLRKYKGNVMLASQHILSPDSPILSKMSKNEFLQKRGLYTPRLGLTNNYAEAQKVANTLKNKQMAFNVMVIAADACTVACQHLLKEIGQGRGHCVHAICDGEPLELAVLSAYGLNRYTFFRPGPRPRLHPPSLQYYKGTPLYFETSSLVAARSVNPSDDVELEARPEFKCVPQLCCDPGAFGPKPPVHWVLLLAAHTDTDVYAVILDPTYGQFNPDGVVDGYKKLRARFPDYTALHTGAPLAIKVASLPPDASTDFADLASERVLMWFKGISSNDVDLTGTSFGMLSGFDLMPDQTAKCRRMSGRVKLQGLVNKPELNGVEGIADGRVTLKDGSSGLKVVVGGSTKKLRRKNVIFLDHC